MVWLLFLSARVHRHGMVTSVSLWDSHWSLGVLEGPMRTSSTASSSTNTAWSQPSWHHGQYMCATSCLTHLMWASTFNTPDVGVERLEVLTALLVQVVCKLGLPGGSLCLEGGLQRHRLKGQGADVVHRSYVADLCLNSHVPACCVRGEAFIWLRMAQNKQDLHKGSFAGLSFVNGVPVQAMRECKHEKQVSGSAHKTQVNICLLPPQRLLELKAKSAFELGLVAVQQAEPDPPKLIL
eukprot:1158208-Pelagomonas_calceolata.AAC.38